MSRADWAAFALRCLTQHCCNADLNRPIVLHEQRRPEPHPYCLLPLLRSSPAANKAFQEQLAADPRLSHLAFATAPAASNMRHHQLQIRCAWAV